MTWRILAWVAVLLLLACLVIAVTPVPSAPIASSTSTSAPPTTIVPPFTSTPVPMGICHARGLLPDPVCTPGAIDPRVTQANISSTICLAGYTATVRPPSSYTDALKVQQVKLYGDTGTTAEYEEDHLIPLEAGGSPSDPRNLWPEPRRIIGGQAEDKDTVENWTHAEICAGRLSLDEAQQRIAADWTTARR